MLVEAPKPSWTDRILLLDLFAGIRTTVKEFFKRPKFTVEYPEERLEPSDRFRGMFHFSYERCIGCKSARCRARSTSSISTFTTRRARLTERRRRSRSWTATTSTSSGACSARSAKRHARPSRSRSS